jgi:hypothetical protein
MGEADWVEAVDTSNLVDVIPLVSRAERAGVTIEFVSLEIRELGGVVTLVVRSAPIDDQSPDFSVPELSVETEPPGQFDIVVVANDFVSLAHIRYRAVMRPRPSSGCLLRVVVSGFELGYEPTPEGVWKSATIRVPLASAAV